MDFAPPIATSMTSAATALAATYSSSSNLVKEYQSYSTTSKTAGCGVSNPMNQQATQVAKLRMRCKLLDQAKKLIATLSI